MAITDLLSVGYCSLAPLLCLRRHQIGSAKQGIERARIRPPSVQGIVGHFPLTNVFIVHIGDLQRSPSGGLEGLYDIENLGVVHVDTGHRIIRGRNGGFLIDAHDLAASNFRDAEPPRILDFLQQDSCPLALLPEIRRMAGDGTLDDIVPEDDTDQPPVGKKFRQRQSRRDTSFAFLVRVVKMREPKLLPIAQQPEEVTGVLPSGDDQYFPHTCFHERFDGIVDHGLVIDGQQVFVRDLGQRKQTRAQSACQNDSLHSGHPTLQKSTTISPVSVPSQSFECVIGSGSPIHAAANSSEAVENLIRVNSWNSWRIYWPRSSRKRSLTILDVIDLKYNFSQSLRPRRLTPHF